MKKLLPALLLLATPASAETAINVYANVMAASVSAAHICPNVGLSNEFFKKMAWQMEMTDKDTLAASRIAIDRLDEIERIAKESGEEAWCARVLPKLMKPINAGELAPLYAKKGGI